MDGQLVLALAPLIVLSGLLQILATVDLVRRERVEIVGGSKKLWALGLLVLPVGPIAYLWLGRDQRLKHRDNL